MKTSKNDPLYGALISIALLLWIVKRTIMSYKCNNFHGHCER